MSFISSIKFVAKIVILDYEYINVLRRGRRQAGGEAGAEAGAGAGAGAGAEAGGEAGGAGGLEGAGQLDGNGFCCSCIGHPGCS